MAPFGKSLWILSEIGHSTLGYEAALLIARYGFQIEPPKDELPRESTPLDVATQRDLLTLVLTGKHTASGLQFLFETGYFHRYWPELGVLKDVSHSKEYHPEGDVWDHTTETFTYRKNPDLAISLALLLHDVGKPHAQTWEGRKFDKHAEIGTRIASQFLRRLGFPEPLVMKVFVPGAEPHDARGIEDSSHLPCGKSAGISLVSRIVGSVPVRPFLYLPGAGRVL
jgi:hypothetical protein